MPRLIDHLERRLGPLAGGWKAEPREGLPSVNVAYFTGGVFRDATSYATVGLSHVPLHAPGRDKHLFMEFVAAEHGPADISLSLFPRALHFVAERCVDSREAVLRGNVIELPENVARDSRFTALYAAIPVYFDDEFTSLTVENGDAVAIVWLVPITSGEAQMIADRGWERFEEQL